MKNPPYTKDALLRNIRKVVPSQVTGSYYRLVSPKRENEILSTQGSFAHGGRYNPISEFGALYLGESMEVCKVERDRQTKEFLLVEQVISKIKVSCPKVLDLTNSGTLKKLGIKKEGILRKEKDGGWDLTWEIARLAYQLGIEGILAPSITEAGNNLVIFDKYLESGEIKIVSKQQEV